METEQTNMNVIIDLEGKQEEQDIENYASVPDDAYCVKLEKVEHFISTKWKSEEKEPKLRFYFRLIHDDVQLNHAIIPFFCTPVIRKVNKEGFSNSKLYDTLENLNMLELVKGHLDYLTNLDNLVDWLNLKFKDRKIKVITKKVNKGTDKEYSRVSVVSRFID